MNNEGKLASVVLLAMSAILLFTDTPQIALAPLIVLLMTIWNSQPRIVTEVEQVEIRNLDDYWNGVHEAFRLQEKHHEKLFLAYSALTQSVVVCHMVRQNKETYPFPVYMFAEDGIKPISLVEEIEEHDNR